MDIYHLCNTHLLEAERVDVLPSQKNTCLWRRGYNSQFYRGGLTISHEPKFGNCRIRCYTLMSYKRVVYQPKSSTFITMTWQSSSALLRLQPLRHKKIDQSKDCHFKASQLSLG